MHYSGILIGLGAFLIIGILHPIVIKTEYYWSKKCWPIYAVAGTLCCVLSLFNSNVIASVLLGVFGFSLFWSIHELFEQEERVRKGWYPSISDRVSDSINKTSQNLEKVNIGDSDMKTILRICSIICFAVAVPLLIIINWYFKDYGLLGMFISICIGLIFDQLKRIYYPNFIVDDDTVYRKNKLIMLMALILFVMSPMAFIYGNIYHESFGTVAFFILVGIGVILDIIARNKYSYSKKSLSV